VLADSLHELSARSNTVRIEHCTFVNSLPTLPSLDDTVLTFLSGAKSARSLLVELGSGRDTVDCDEEESLRPHNLSDTTIEVPSGNFTGILNMHTIICVFLRVVVVAMGAT
jgi:hypothetical protein